MSGLADNVSDMTSSVELPEASWINTAKPLGIHEALVKVIKELPGIGKDSTGKGLSYNYRGIEDIVPVVKRLFAEHGVHMTATHESITDADGLGKSNNMRRAVLQSTFRFYALDGSFVETTTIGEAMDVSDKVHNKAMTAAYKYALIQTLTIADGDDPDAYRPETDAAPQVVTPDGHLTAADAKTEFLNACDGDTDCARTKWEAAALTPLMVAGQSFYAAAEVIAAAALAKSENSENSEPNEPSDPPAENPTEEPGDDTNPFPEPDRS